MAKIHQIALVAFVESILFQHSFHILEHASCGKIPVLCVEDQKVLNHLHILDMRKQDTVRGSTCFDGNALVFFLLRKPVYLVHFYGKRLIFHRLENIIKSLDLIAPDRIFRHICNKDQDNLFICFPNFFRSLHAVHLRHFHIQENHVIARTVLLQKLTSVRIFRHLDLHMFLFPILFQKA